MKVSKTFEWAQHSQDHRFESPLLDTIFDTLPTTLETVLEFKSKINPQAIGTPTCNIDLLHSDETQWPELQREKQVSWKRRRRNGILTLNHYSQNIAFVEAELENELAEMKKTYDFPMAYNNVSGIEVMSRSPRNTIGNNNHGVFRALVLDRSEEYNGEKGTTTMGQDQ